jgi:hypothetical protein
VILDVLGFVSVELGAGRDLILSAKWGPVHPLRMHTQVLVRLTVCDKDYRIGLE